MERRFVSLWKRNWARARTRFGDAGAVLYVVGEEKVSELRWLQKQYCALCAPGKRGRLIRTILAGEDNRSAGFVRVLTDEGVKCLSGLRSEYRPPGGSKLWWKDASHDGVMRQHFAKMNKEEVYKDMYSRLCKLFGGEEMVQGERELVVRTERLALEWWRLYAVGVKGDERGFVM